MQKNNKFLRTKFIRSLEKFFKSVINVAKKDDFDEVKFREFIAKKGEILEKVEPIFLDSLYTKSLVEFANLALNGAEKLEIIKKANSIEKIKNAKYKKQKHKGKFDEF